MEDGAEGGGVAVGHFVDGLDESVDFGRHDEKVARGRAARIPIGVGRAAGNEDGRASTSFNDIAADLDVEDSFEDIPGLVIVVMEMARSDEAWRSRRAAGIAPFGDDKALVGGTDDVTGERRDDEW